MFGTLDYEGIVIRPPSEAESLIIQITLGCSDNRCIFCPAYKEKYFRIKDLHVIEKEIIKASKYYPDTRRLFFADGDAVTIKQEELIKIFETALRSFPKLTRISLYGSIKSLKAKSVNDLIELKKRKLNLIYLGFETGDQEVYKLINKYGSPLENLETCLKLKEAGIKVNTTVILGLGGKKLSCQNAVNTAKLLNNSRPDQIAALTLMIAKNTPLYAMEKQGIFKPLEGFEFIEELNNLIKNMDDFNCLFFSNHASNYFPIQARFPKDKPYVLKELNGILTRKDKNILAPEWQRGL
ncbi:MAG: radical SAM protein [Elusimicrobia bacterium]|nr:radical SAM protein [Candidatus Liberimonas magnetica]